MESDEQVVLLGEDGAAIGTAPKRSVHHRETPLHLAFSCHVIGPDGRVLVTRRALSKRTWPGVWTNSFCGHPRPGEEITDAVRRHAASELGITVHTLRLELPDFRYRATDASGVVENEVCPVFIARTDDAPQPNPDEVAEFAWVEAESLSSAVTATPFAFSPWLAMQVPQLPLFTSLERLSR